MADGEAVSVTLEASPVDHPHKRKLEDLEPSDVAAPDSTVQLEGDLEGDHKEERENGDDEEPSKRPRLDELPDGLASENGHKPVGDHERLVENDETAAENLVAGDEHVKEPVLGEGNEVQSTPEGGQQSEVEGNNSEVKDVLPASEKDEPENLEKPSGDEHQEPATEETEQGDAASGQPTSESGTRTMTRKIEIPNNKVGVLIGKAGDTIKYLQINSGAKIQFTRDADADPRAPSRPVELVGTLESLNKAERLIKDVIAEADAGGSPSLVARGFTATLTSGSAEIEIPVPSDKVGLIIGRGGETIRSLQTRSGARIQLIPQNVPGEQSKEKKVKVSGDKKQVEMAKELIKEVMNQLPGRPSQFSGNAYGQQGYRPRGPGGAPQWGTRGPPHATPYDYQQRGPHPSHGQHYPPQSYGNYPPQGPPRSGYGSGWEQRPPSQGPPHSGGYDYYGHAHAPNAPASGPQSSHMPGHQSGPTMAPPHSQANYNYSQPRGSDYSQPSAYSHTAPQSQGYGHGYGDPKYDGQGQVQQPYGGQGFPPQQQQGYPPQHQQQYNRPPAPYGAPSQQGYGPPTASQPTDTPYQAPASAAQPYGQNVQQQQQPYQYPSGAPTQAPYGSAPITTDGYAQPQPTSGYPQPGGQPVASYGQPPSGYGQAAASAGGYGQYPQATQPGYSDQSAAAAAASYGYQGQVDQSAYGAGQAYGAAPAVAQQGYAQQAPAQAGYVQSAAAQPGGYAGAPAAAPVAAVGKTVSPQPGYPQYDASQQMYAAPR